MVPERNPRLVGIGGPLKGTSFALPDGEVSIGRDSSNHLWAPDPAMSRRHCSLVASEQEVSIRDLGSRNGTLVNGVPVEQQQIRHGDQIYIGDSVLLLLLQEDGEPRSETRSSSRTLRRLRVLPFYCGPKTRATCNLTCTLKPSARVRLSRPAAPVTSIPCSRSRPGLAAFVTRTRCNGSSWVSYSTWFPPSVAQSCSATTRRSSLLTAAWDRVRGPGHPVRVSRTVVQRALTERVGLVVSDVLGDESLRQIKTLVDLKVRSLLCVPPDGGQPGSGSHLSGHHQPKGALR